MRLVVSSVFLMSAAAAMPVMAQQANLPLTPPQAAYLKLQLQKAEDKMVAQISVATAVAGPVVRHSIPDRARITDPVARIIAALEKYLKRPLSEEQKAVIQQAEAEYQEAVRVARSSATNR